MRKSQHQDLRADLVWSINSWKIESRRGALPDFRHQQRYCFPQVLGSSVGRITPGWWACWTHSSQSCVPRSSQVRSDGVFWDEHRREEHPDLPVYWWCSMAYSWSVRSRWNWQLLFIALASSVWAEEVGRKRLCQSLYPLGLEGRNDKESRTFCPICLFILHLLLTSVLCNINGDNKNIALA